MIKRMLNLKCTAGHKHYAPRWWEWLGHECFTHVPPSGRCHKKLYAYQEKDNDS
jgi:hypothetical protein